MNEQSNADTESHESIEEILTHHPTKIWRYMDFTKFISVLDTQTLFFSRIDLLGDKFEGSVPKGFYESLIPRKKQWIKMASPKNYVHDIAEFERDKETIQGSY
jgi:hypothetical protein